MKRRVDDIFLNHFEVVTLPHLLLVRATITLESPSRIHLLECRFQSLGLRSFGRSEGEAKDTICPSASGIRDVFRFIPVGQARRGEQTR